MNTEKNIVLNLDDFDTLMIQLQGKKYEVDKKALLYSLQLALTEVHTGIQ